MTEDRRRASQRQSCTNPFKVPSRRWTARHPSRETSVYRRLVDGTLTLFDTGGPLSSLKKCFCHETFCGAGRSFRRAQLLHRFNNCRIRPMSLSPLSLPLSPALSVPLSEFARTPKGHGGRDDSKNAFEPTTPSRTPTAKEAPKSQANFTLQRTPEAQSACRTTRLRPIAKTFTSNWLNRTQRFCHSSVTVQVLQSRTVQLDRIRKHSEAAEIKRH